MNFIPLELRECAPLPVEAGKQHLKSAGPEHNIVLVVPVHAAVQPQCPPTPGGFCTASNIRRVVRAEAHRTGAACARALRCCNAYAWIAADGTGAVNSCEDTGGREAQRYVEGAVDGKHRALFVFLVKKTTAKKRILVGVDVGGE